MAKADENTAWSRSVKALLKQGYGVEDVAVFLNCDAQHVRNEVSIYRDEGRLGEITYKRRIDK